MTGEVEHLDKARDLAMAADYDALAVEFEALVTSAQRTVETMTYRVGEARRKANDLRRKWA